MVMSFIEQFEAAGNELEKKFEECKNGAMIMIAYEEPNKKGFYVDIKGKSSMVAELFAYVAYKDFGFKMLLKDAIKIAEMQEQEEDL